MTGAAPCERRDGAASQGAVAPRRPAHYVGTPSPSRSFASRLEPPSPEPALDPNRDEHRIIELLLSARGPRPDWVRLDAGHDCAVVRPAGDLALTVDTLVEGVHFAADAPSEDVGFKAVAVSVSDLGAARARPTFLLLAVSMRRDLDAQAREAWIAGLARGIRAACDRFGVHLVGGDVTATPAHGPAVVSVTMGGSVIDAARSRAGARPGDRVWLTGWPGLAGAGWAWPSAPAEAVAALRRPDPPLAFALALDLATAAMDLSDGLGADLFRLCAASGVGASIDPDALPVHPSLRGFPPDQVLQVMIGGGDDYGLLFTAPVDRADRIGALARAHGVQAQDIGVVTAERSVTLVGRAWPAPLFAHFANAAAERR